MKIEQVSLKNFRCFEQLDVTFHPQMTVLIAPNGAGKSTILDAVAVAVSPYVAAFDLGKGRPIAKSDARYLRKEQMTSSEQMFPVEITARFNEPACQIKRALTGINNKTTIKEASELAAYGESLMSQVRNLQDVNLPLVAYYGTSRLWLEHRNMDRKAVVSASRSMGYEDCLTPASNFKQLQQWFTKATFAELQQQQMTDVYQGYSLKEQIAGIQAAIDSVLQPASGWLNFHYSFSHEELAMSHPEQGILPVELLSDGVRAMVSLVADLAWRCGKLNPQFGALATKKTRGIVLIDEVDMFLHPAWQQQVLGALQQAFPQVQFIVTTHSPQVLTTIDKDCIRLFRQSPENNISRTEVVTPQWQTKGVGSADVLASIMGIDPVPSVPEALALSRYKQMIEMDQLSSSDADQLREQLLAHFGATHPLMLECERLIRLQSLKKRLPPASKSVKGPGSDA
ncbi:MULTISPECIES: AAA family ATPase [Shewanella]|uniref:AAA family ATPase n=1 Tax=Shewanella TaxID=22 RepID=UPI00163F1192|nr:AAA family ATPase [Shewanella algae]QNH97485.1 AAA family ATPase [Shewanella algae]